MSSAFGLLLLHASVSSFFDNPSHLTAVEDGRTRQLPEDVTRLQVASKPTVSVANRLWLFVLLLLALSGRVSTVRVLLNNRRCIFSGIEVKRPTRTIGRPLTSTQGFLPLLLAIHDYWFKQRRKSADKISVHDQKSGSLVRRAFLGQHRYLLPATGLSIIYACTVSLKLSPPSTYICPISNLNRLSVPLLQAIGVSLDFFVLLKLPTALEPHGSTAGAAKASSPVFVGFVLLVSLCASVCL